MTTRSFPGGLAAQAGRSVGALGCSGREKCQDSALVMGQPQRRRWMRRVEGGRARIAACRSGRCLGNVNPPAGTLGRREYRLDFVRTATATAAGWRCRRRQLQSTTSSMRAG